MNVVQFKSEPSPRFEEFWKAYPRRCSKMLAKAKWDKITNGGMTTHIKDHDSGEMVEIFLQATADEIIAGAKRYYETQIDKKTWKLKDDGKYTCHPATWLNRGRWLDE